MAIVEEVEEVLVAGNLGEEVARFALCSSTISPLGSLEEGGGEAGECMGSSC